MAVYTHTTTTPLGRVILAAGGDGLCGLWFEGARHVPDPSPWTPDAAHPAIREAVTWLDAYFAGLRPVFLSPMTMAGTAFREAVWRRLLDIPYGQTATYGQLADDLAGPDGAADVQAGRGRVSARAVGGAVGRNPISLIVPCHRVIGAGGALVGYGGGLDRKKALLALESMT
jgi:methylated-DNA-[protein]-cysteine S-methyltransferase